jgi:hypothetical protein
MCVTSWDPAGLAVVLGVYAWVLLIVYEADARVYGSAVPAIATAPPETGGRRGTGRECQKAEGEAIVKV